MQYALVFTAAALGQLVEAQHHEFRHARHHKRDYQVDVAYTTVTQYVTAGASSSTVAGTSTSVAPVETSSASSSTWSAPSTCTTFSTSAFSTSAFSTSASVTYSTANNVISAYSSSTSTSTSTSISATSSSTQAASSGITLNNLTPNGKKAGLSGYVGCQDLEAFTDLAPYISWYSDYTATTPDAQGVLGIGMLWGADGSACPDTSSRLSAFNSMISADKTPSIMFGFYEPDCSCPDSADMTTAEAALDWDNLIAPLASDGTVLGSPSMCKQKDETFLTPFNSAITTTWDVTSIHINKPDIDGVKAVVEYYWDTYQKPIWVSEFACVNDSPSWVPCTDQDQINTFVNDAVAYFNDNEHVVAFGPSNGNGLGDVWPLTDSNGQLTTTGTTYLNAIKSL